MQAQPDDVWRRARRARSTQAACFHVCIRVFLSQYQAGATLAARSGAMRRRVQACGDRALCNRLDFAVSYGEMRKLPS